jgi:hypothetical protein
MAICENVVANNRKTPLNMIYKNTVYGFIIIVMTMTSCIVYHPQTADIPLISKKKDLRLDAGISIVPSAHATISYGLTDKIAIQTFGSIGSDDRYYFQGAAGLFKNYSNQKTMEFYSGFGYGYGSAYRDAHPGDLYGDYQIYFIQFNFGKIDCKFANMDYGFGLKSGYLHSNLTDYNYYRFYSETGPFTTYKDNSLLIEPTIFVRLGGERLKLNIKVGGSWINKFTHTNKGFPYSFINFGLGLNYRLCINNWPQYRI